MEVNRLLGDELSYELQIRGLPVSGTVNEKRAMLRQVFRLERAGETHAPDTTELDPGHELSICRDKLGDLQEAIASFDSTNRENEYKRLNSRLIHLNCRLARLKCDSSDFEQQRVALLESCKQLSDSLESAFEEAQRANVSVSLIDMPVPLVPEVVRSTSNVKKVTAGQTDGNDPLDQDAALSIPRVIHALQTYRESHQQAGRVVETVDGGNSRNRPQIQGRPQTIPVAQSTRENLFRQGDDNYSNRVNSSIGFSTQLRHLQLSPSKASGHDQPQVDIHGQTDFDDRWRTDIGRWNLKYDGISSVNSFLERIEELRLSRGISKTRLLQSAPELFTKDALLWYRMSEFSNWDDLVQQLRAAFQPFDYEFTLMEEIRRRSQGAQEKVISYVSVMENLFKRLSQRPPEEERVKIIRRNLLPHIQTQLSLHTTYTIAELIRLARSVEETEWRVQRFCPPPTNPRNLVEPEMAYRRPQHVAAISSAHSRARPATSAQASEATPQPDRPPSNCWNCGKPGHKFNRCSEVKGVFCYKCGKPNVTAVSCPDCSKNRGRGRH
nr:unnamed protein product [Callosobruchus analis]CAI5845815.1 unnamed protein product [Callosobruchus analis]